MAGFMNPHWKNYLFRTQYELTAASYIRCPVTWRDEHFVPSFNRFYLIMDGEGVLELDGKRYYPKPNQLYLLPADVVQSYSTISEHTFLKYWCHFTARIGGMNLFSLLKTPVFIEIEDMQQLVQQFKTMIDLHPDEECSSVFRLQSILLSMISMFIEHSNPESISLNVSPSMGRIDQLLAYIDQHLSSPLTIELLAEQSHYHPNHLIRIFKQFTGYSPIQYINRRRIDTAKQSLVLTNQSISYISESVAMSPYYFSRMFKEATGYSPSDYRKMNGEENKLRD